MLLIIYSPFSAFFIYLKHVRCNRNGAWIQRRQFTNFGSYLDIRSLAVSNAAATLFGIVETS